MIEPIADLPAGVTGLRASGELTKEDYVEVLEPALRAAAASEGGIRLLFVLDSFDGLGHGAWVEDMKTGLQAWVRDHARWRRMALVTDVEWIARALRAFAWMAPGEVKAFASSELDAAVEWVAG